MNERVSFVTQMLELGRGPERVQIQDDAIEQLRTMHEQQRQFFYRCAAATILTARFLRRTEWPRNVALMVARMIWAMRLRPLSV